MSGLPPHCRLIKACAKCHARKVKCDGRLPRCTHCDRANASCNVGDGIVWAHAHVAGLEDRIRWLEQLVADAYSTDGPVSAVATGAQLAPKRSKQTAVDHFPEEVGLLSHRACGSYLGSMSGVTFGLMVSSAISLFAEAPLLAQPIDLPPPPRVTTRAGLPTLATARRLVARYLDRVHRWHPFLDLDSLGRDLEGVYGRARSAWARFVLFAVCAIGADDADADAHTGPEYLETALAFLGPVLQQQDMDTVCALLLLIVYGLRSRDEPHALNVWLLAGHAMRLAVQLGITRDNPKWDFSPHEQERRRRVFYCTLGVERYVAALTGRSTSVRREAIDAPLPAVLDEACPPSLARFLGEAGARAPLDLRPAVHLIRQRCLLGEVLERPRRVFQLQNDLVSWAQELGALAPEGSAAHAVLGLAFHQATLLLHRPSPSFPAPTPEALDVCLGAARGWLGIAGEALAAGSLQDVCPGWGAVEGAFGAALALLYCSWLGPTCPHALQTTDDPALALAEEVLSLAPAYAALFRAVVSAFGGMIAGQPLDIASVLATAGLANMDNLDLDEDSIAMIAQMLDHAR